jgi:hypothetical protein
MGKRPLPEPSRTPRWLIALASVAIVFHLSAVLVRALAAPSGPWPTPQGGTIAGPPPFALALYQWLPGDYLKALQMTHNYHFPTNRPGLPAVSFEVHLKDAAGKELAAVTVPDPNANVWLRHRQTLLAAALGLDEPVMPPQMEAIPAPNRAAPSVALWEMVPNTANRLELKRVPEHLIPRDRPVLKPSDVSMVFVRSYARYLCRTHGAASAQVVRHHRDPIPPDVLFGDNVPADAFDEVTSNFGELAK